MLNIVIKNSDWNKAYTLSLLLRNELTRAQNSVINIKDEIAIVDKAPGNKRAKCRLSILDSQLQKEIGIISMCEDVLSQFGSFVEDTGKMTQEELIALDKEEELL